MPTAGSPSAVLRPDRGRTARSGRRGTADWEVY